MAGCIWSRIQFDGHPQDTGLICAPTYKILQQSTLPKFFQINPDLQKYYKKGESMIEVPERGRIYIRSTENPNVLEGMTLRWCWMDEGGQMKLDAWINIQGRLSIQQGKCFISTTPYYFNWLASDFLAQCKDKNPDYCAVQFRSIDSPYFPKEEYERAEKTMDRRTFERRYMGLFTKMEGLVYDDFNYAYHVNDNIPDKFDAVICGVDWGFSAPASLVIMGIKDNVFWIVDEYYASKKTQDELIEIAKNLKERWQINRFYADTAEPDRIEAFKRAGLYTLEANKDIDWGLSKVRQAMKEERFHVHPRCKYLLDEIERYHYPEVQEDKVESEKPEKIDDHCFIGDTLITLANGKQKKIKNIKVGELVKTQNGENEVLISRLSRKNTPIVKVDFSNGSSLIGTGDHKIYTGRGKISIDDLRYDDIIETLNSNNLSLWKKQSLSIISDITGMVNIMHQWEAIKTEGKDYIKQFGNITMEKSQKDAISIIKMETEKIIQSLILSFSQLENIYQTTIKSIGKKKNLEKKLERIAKILDHLRKYGTVQMKELSGIVSTEKKIGLIGKQLGKYANSVERSTKLITPTELDFAITIVKRKLCGREDVYSLTVENEHNFYANGVLVKNCMDAMRYAIATYQGNKFAKPNQKKVFLKRPFTVNRIF